MPDTAVSSSEKGPLPAFRARQRAGGLHPDPAQALAAEKLQALHHALLAYRPQGGTGGWRERFGLGRRERPDPPQGLYIFGRVGRGKSMLMDLFFETVPTEAKRRVHFHAFMLEVQAALHALRQSGGVQNPLSHVAADIAKRSWLLCFDEFQVGNIADAMILGRLFEALFDEGVVIVATSNTAPDDLYKNGLQRDRFLPFLDVLRARLDVLELDGAVDYRRDRIRGMAVYHSPLGPRAAKALEDAFAQLTEGAAPVPDTLIVQGRTVPVPRAARGVAWFGFGDLCEKPLGAADFLAVATHFHTVLVSDIPVLAEHQRSEALRFITLIDALYEHRTKLVCSAEGSPERICAAGEAAPAFQRAISRLHEMQSEDYLAEPHLE